MFSPVPLEQCVPDRRSRSGYHIILEGLYMEKLNTSIEMLLKWYECHCTICMHQASFFLSVLDDSDVTHRKPKWSDFFVLRAIKMNQL